MDYKQKLEKIRKRDVNTYLYHLKHPEARLGNARDRRAGYNSRQSVFEAIKRVKARIASGEIKLPVEV